MIKIGGSCGGRYSRPIIGITSYENRILQNNEHTYFWEDSEFCIRNKIYLIVNIDSYITGGRWHPTNQQLRDFTIATKNQLKSIGANKYNCRFTCDNESEEWDNFGNYCNRVRVIHDALNGEFDLGAGNFGTNARSWYDSLANLYNQGYYEVFDVHYQRGLDDSNDISAFSNWILSLKNTYGLKRIAVTEGNNFYNVSTQQGHELLKFQISEAERIGCEDFCFVYANWMHNGIESDDNMSYNYNFNPVSSYWQDMLNLIQSKKPIEILEVEDMKLERYYYKGRDPKLIKDDIKGYGIMFLRACFGLTHSAVFDDALVNKVKQYQAEKGLLVDSIVGPQTFGDMIKIADYYKHYCWVHSLWARGLVY